MRPGTYRWLRRARFHYLVPLAVLLGPTVLHGQSDPEPRSVAASERPVRVLQAVRLDGPPPVIDGDLSDPAWRDAPVATGFTQLEPHEGAPASERTEARILYDDDALYVAFRAYDAEPDSIVAQLTRRGEMSYSDRVHVLVDSYFDRRTAFHFAVNPLGVKTDIYRYDDDREDAGWEAVWDVATQIDSLGWTAEFRIPLSQLRFARAAEQTWGINFGREIARRNELSVWAPSSVRERAVVSRFGHLEGIRDLSPPRRVELLPYSAGRLARAPVPAGDPFSQRTDGTMEIGVDARIGVTSNMTLDLAVNPDFGQVEADPARVNLTAFETFYPEQRPFFLEGAGIFRFGIGMGDGDGNNQTLFYSRRVGRAPQGFAPAGSQWVDRPAQTRILGAGKLSGQTDGGWSLGLLNAVTGDAVGRAVVGGEAVHFDAEPRTNYSVARLQRDLREGESSIGAIATATVRDGSVSDALGLRRDAVAGGVDARHRFRDGTVEIRGHLLGSRISGSESTIARTQASSARYFQRPDADHLTFDPAARSLAGWSSSLEIMKMGGGPWRFGAITQARSPGFEVNDLGFMPEADYIAQAGFVGYFQNEPGQRLRTWAINTNAFSSWTFGGEHTQMGGNVNGQIVTNGNFMAFSGVAGNAGGLNPRLLRGGPAMRTDTELNGWGGFQSDSRRELQFSWNHNWNLRPAGGSWSYRGSPGVRWRPSDRAGLRAGPFFERRIEDRQWVTRVDTSDGPEYVFGRMTQSTAGLTLRADLAVTNTLSVQLYAQPFMSAGSFEDFRRVSDPRADRYEDRFTGIDATYSEGRYLADLNADGEMESFHNPDFDVMQFRSNAVVRWEYRPGSTVYLVWAQARNHFARDGEFRLGGGLDTLFSERPENVFMIKVNYWLNP